MSSNQFCQHCVTLNEIPGKPSGQEAEVGGVASYVAKGSKKGTILIATDIYGLGIDNPKLLADHFAKESGFTTIVPDIFNGEPMGVKDFKLPKHSDDPQPEGADKNFDNFGAWLGKGHGPDNSYPIFKKVIDAVGKDGPVGVSGYCYGGKICSLAAQEGGVVKGVAIHHPAMLEKGEEEKIKVPVLLSMSEMDPIFADEVKSSWVDGLKKKNLLDSGSQTYPKSVHGHAIRPDLNKPEIKKAFEESLKNAVTFFGKVLA